MNKTNYLDGGFNEIFKVALVKVFFFNKFIISVTSVFSLNVYLLLLPCKFFPWSRIVILVHFFTGAKQLNLYHQDLILQDRNI
jgi:hypothetical protein